MPFSDYAERRQHYFSPLSSDLPSLFFAMLIFDVAAIPTPAPLPLFTPLFDSSPMMTPILMRDAFFHALFVDAERYAVCLLIRAIYAPDYAVARLMRG